MNSHLLTNCYEEVSRNKILHLLHKSLEFKLLNNHKIYISILLCIIRKVEKSI